MTKHKITYNILWVFYTVPAIAFFSWIVFCACLDRKIPAYASIIIICCALFILSGISFLLYHYSKPYTEKQLNVNKKFAYFAPEIAFIGVISVRILKFLYSSEILYGRLSYLTDAYVTNDTFIAPDFLTNPFVYLLENVMHYTMKILGNQEAAIVYLFIVLQFVSALFLYYALRNIWGSLSAFLITVLFYCNPEVTRTIFYVSELQIVLPIFIFMFFILSLFIRYREHSDKSCYMALYVLFSIMNGAFIYFETSFLIILIFGFLYFLFDVDKKTSIMKPFIISIELISTAAGFFLFLIVPMSIKGCEYLTVLNEYSNQFKLFLSWEPSKLLLGNYNNYLIIQSVLLLFYIDFALVKKEKQKSKNIYPAFFTTILILLYLLFVAENTIIINFAFLWLSITSILSIQGFRYQMESDINLKNDTESQDISIDEIIPESVIEPIIEQTILKPRVILPGQPLDNPLPVPKKHVKKEFDYVLNVTDENMHYDINIDDNDDYDLK